MRNVEVAKALFDLADVMDMLSIEWKPIAVRKGARAIETLTEDVEDIYKEKGIEGLEEIPGIGAGLGKKIAEFLTTGKMTEYEQLKKKVPAGLSEIIEIQGMGPKKAWKLWKKIGVDSVESLEKAAKEGKIRKLEGFGQKSEEDILRGLEMLKVRHERMLLGQALPIAESIVSKLKKLKSVKKADVAGSTRRMKETVGDIDILVISDKPKEVMDFFTSLPEIGTVLLKGSTKTAVVLKAGLNCDVRVVPEKSYGAALNYFTGSKDHNIHLRQLAIKKGWTLSEYGLFKVKGHKYLGGKTEEELFKMLGMPYIEPELRENDGEIEAALKNKLPNLIKYGSAKGDLHVHTTWSDGVNSSEEMLRAAEKENYEYLAFTEHSKSEYIAGGLAEGMLTKRLLELDKLQKKTRIKIFKGAEVDILPDGKLDYSAATLKKLDFVIGSIHSGFKSPQKFMTKRIVTAIESGQMNMLGHPTGRIINEREAYDVDLDAVFDAAKANRVALEINAHPARLDLNGVNIRRAVAAGVRLGIGTDSHSVDHLKFMRLGIATARRGWSESKDILNTLPLKKFEKTIAR